MSPRDSTFAEAFAWSCSPLIKTLPKPPLETESRRRTLQCRPHWPSGPDANRAGLPRQITARTTLGIGIGSVHLFRVVTRLIGFKFEDAIDQGGLHPGHCPCTAFGSLKSAPACFCHNLPCGAASAVFKAPWNGGRWSGRERGLPGERARCGGVDGRHSLHPAGPGLSPRPAHLTSAGPCYLGRHRYSRVLPR